MSKPEFIRTYELIRTALVADMYNKICMADSNEYVGRLAEDCHRRLDEMRDADPRIDAWYSLTGEQRGWTGAVAA